MDDLFDTLPEPTDKLVWIDSRIFRDAFDRAGLTHSQVARRARIFRSNRPTDPDPTAIKRALGGHRVTYETAVRLCRGLNVPYHEAGV